MGLEKAVDTKLEVSHAASPSSELKPKYNVELSEMILGGVFELVWGWACSTVREEIDIQYHIG